MEFTKKYLIKKSLNLSDWYNNVVLQAELADYSPVKGCMVIRPYGYGIWEKIQYRLNRMISDAGVQNAYFPLFIPKSFLEKEKEHVEGFSPELAVVTIGGGEKLADPLVVRPTSETMMYEMFSKWIHSWRDLPLLINQWCNVVRWEKRTYLFLRTTEFLWQEGHTVHETHEQSGNEVNRALMMYKTFVEDYLAMPVICGTKSGQEKFAGAEKTTAIEALMPDGKALQVGTSHDLGQNFAKVFKISFQDKEGNKQFGWQTSWGMSTRIIGGIIMMHGDDQGLILPPKVAPIQAVLVPIDCQDKELRAYTEKIAEDLEKENIRTKVDLRDEETAGYKFNEWELKGVPIRLEIGKKELKENTVTVYRREEKIKIKYPREGIQEIIVKMLKEIQKNLLDKAKIFLQENTRKVTDYKEFKEIMGTKKGFIKAFWCEDTKCEQKIKEETKATTRVLPFEEKEQQGNCIYCGNKAKYQWIFAQAY